jgi:hypothetical protein
MLQQCLKMFRVSTQFDGVVGTSVWPPPPYTGDRDILYLGVATDRQFVIKILDNSLDSP